jgi:DNA primase
MNKINLIKQNLSLVDLLEFYQFRLYRKGRLYAMRCPFHADNVPSFIIYPATNTFYCFGCGKTGDIIDFVKEYFEISISEAINKILEDFNISLENLNYNPNILIKQEDQIKDWLFYHDVLEYIDFLYTEVKKAPKTIDDLDNPFFVEACHKHEYIKYLLEKLTSSIPFEREEAIEEIKKCLEGYIKRAEYIEKVK